ncbi:hypothetical protein LSAT2_012294 [Lamellibrachia satsuma]|nr:hypothetical protein LSAT2_012294 [Lamellibrachia satsuma]
MATPLAAAGVIGQLNNPEYLNWVKATRAVHITMEAMRTFCQVKMQDLHQQLLLKHGGTQCSGPCSSTNITYNRSTNNYVMNCPNSVCSGWLADIVAERAATTTRLTFGNCDISQWPVQPWQIAKAFMNKQEPSSVSPNDTDASGILQLLKNCKYFTPFLDTSKAHVVQQVRNCVMHTSTMKVTTADLSTYMTNMIDLLQDSSYLLNDPVAQQAAQQVQQILTTPIDVSDAAFKAQECQAWRHALSAADKRRRKIIRKIVASNRALEDRLQAEIKEVKRTLQGSTRVTICLLLTLVVGLVAMFVAVLLQSSGQLGKHEERLETHGILLDEVKGQHGKHEERLQGHDSFLGEVQGQLGKHEERLETHGILLDEVKEQHGKHEDRLQGHDSFFGEVQGQLGKLKEHLETHDILLDEVKGQHGKDEDSLQGHDRFIGKVQGQLVKHEGRLQTFGSLLGEVQEQHQIPHVGIEYPF